MRSFFSSMAASFELFLPARPKLPETHRGVSFEFIVWSFTEFGVHPLDRRENIIRGDPFHRAAPHRSGIAGLND